MKAAALLLLAVAPAPQQFNLVCSGTIEVVRLGGVDKAPYSRTLRIDLGSGQWCADDCGSVEPIARVEPSRLLLRNEKRDTPREYRVEIESVDRVTGDHSIIADNGLRGPAPRSAFSTGHCQLAPFTGLARGIIYLTPEAPSGRYLLVMWITL